jgi:hypothetical protein
VRRGKINYEHASNCSVSCVKVHINDSERLALRTRVQCRITRRSINRVMRTVTSEYTGRAMRVRAPLDHSAIVCAMVGNHFH